MSKEKFEIVNCKGMQASVTSLGIGIREVGCESIGRKGICLIDVQKCTHLFPESSDQTSKIAIYYDERKLKLSPIETKILNTLIENLGKPLTGKALSEVVWEAGVQERVYSRVNQLRKKLGGERESVIKYKKNSGYFIVEPNRFEIQLSS